MATSTILNEHASTVLYENTTNPLAPTVKDTAVSTTLQSLSGIRSVCVLAKIGDRSNARIYMPIVDGVGSTTITEYSSSTYYICIWIEVQTNTNSISIRVRNIGDGWSSAIASHASVYKVIGYY